MKKVRCVYQKDAEFTDPDTKGIVTLEIWKDPESGALVGIDESYLASVQEQVFSPYNKNTILLMKEDFFEGQTRKDKDE